MKQIIKLRETAKNVREKYRLNLNIHNYNQVTFGKKDFENILTENLKQFALPHYIFKKS